MTNANWTDRVVPDPTIPRATDSTGGPAEAIAWPATSTRFLCVPIVCVEISGRNGGLAVKWSSRKTGHSRLGLARGVLAFFFNVVVTALTINIIAGLL
jgi:hypothetical protein